jgi:DNA-directed RNA polymerases I and III subunit RPAC1
MYDEIFAQRVGLVPLKANPRKFDWKEGSPTDLNTIVFNIDVTCKKNPEAKQGEVDPLKKYEHAQVLSKDIVWNPEGDQAEKFEHDPISVMYDDIVLTRLNNGQTIKGSLHAIKGIGREHAKWSPVGKKLH